MRTNLRVFRVQRKMRQKEFAEILGVSQAVYSNIELGKSNAKLGFWDNLRNTFDVPEEEMWKLMKEDE